MSTSSTKLFVSYWWITILLIALLNNLGMLTRMMRHSEYYDTDVIDQPSVLVAPNGRGLIKCLMKNRQTQEKIEQYLTPEEFYAGDRKKRCKHSFNDDTVVFHLGKGGGGTLMKVFNIGVKWVHPEPRSSINEQLLSGPLNTLIVNVRDPIDRFVSAFNWRLAILCHPNDERHRGKKSVNGKVIGATKHPNEYCKTGSEEEEILLRQTYHSSPSILAEALCGSPMRGKDDFYQVHHSLTLTDWLDFLIDPTLHKGIKDDGIKNFIVLPVEKQPGANETLFEQHIEKLEWHLLQNRYGSQIGEEMMRLASEQRANEEAQLGHKLMKAKSKNQTLLTTAESNHKTYLHSSAKFYNNSLTPLGECCLARFLVDDYRLIQTMLGHESDQVNAVVEPLVGAHPILTMACTWGNEEQQQLCRLDLRSMLMRRALYLDESKGSCAAIVSSDE
ncbi:hypothetical protein ACHAWC_004306 [Mediolabrus comicus]